LDGKPKRRGKVMSDYEKWEIKQLINSGEGCRETGSLCAQHLFAVARIE
jgi:hypothetical protein